MSYFDTSSDRRLKELAAGLTTADIGVTVQAFDGDLSAVATLTSTGLLVRTGSESWATRNITNGSSAISITNPGGVAGDIILDVVASGVDHGGLSGLADDDHTQYLLASQATDRATFTTNWADLTGGGSTTLHTHDHGGLGGLLDDDHTQYALLAGRSGGQTLKGGTASGDGLTLMSTNHATKGSILFGDSAYDEVNNRLGIGITSPTTTVHIVESLASGICEFINYTQTAPQTTDTNNIALYASLLLSASSATDNLVSTANFVSAQNILTGGGDCTFLRGVESFGATGAGSVTTNYEGFRVDYVNVGTTTNAYGFRVASLGGTNLFGVADDVGTTWYNNGSAALLGLGTATPSVTLDCGSKTDAIAIPRGTTVQRPAAINGLLRYNTDTEKFEAREAGAWIDVIGGSSGGFSATTVEVNLGSSPVFRGKFTITDAGISATSKVLCWQAPGPYTGKGTRADEAEAQPVEIISVEPASGSATVYWQTPPMTGYKVLNKESRLNAASTVAGAAINQQLPLEYTPVRLGKVRGNVKFSYAIAS